MTELGAIPLTRSLQRRWRAHAGPLRLVASVLALLAATAGSALAQVSSGETVRATLGGRELMRGVYLYRDSTTVTMLSLVTGDTLNIFLADSITIEVQAGGEHRGWRATDIRRVPSRRELARLADPRLVMAGDTILVRCGDIARRGTLAGNDSARVWLVEAGRGDTTRIAHAEVSSASVLRGKQPRGMRALGRGVATGAGVAATLGAMLLAGSSEGDGKVIAGILTLFGGGAAILTGTVIGAAGASQLVDVWTPFDVATLRVLGS